MNDGSPSANTLECVGARLGATKLLTYQSCTIGLTRNRLDGLGLKDIDPGKVREMDAVDQIGNMQRIGQAIAKEQVNMGAGAEFLCVGRGLFCSGVVPCARAIINDSARLNR